uniref:USP domain-containing protein n=1 Tax=Macrostomum lignano TaxID=282301 RepID=A0A1I8HH05_9PLAT
MAMDPAVGILEPPPEFVNSAQSPNSMHPQQLIKGLANDPGSNSCFLNSAVQLLWHQELFQTGLNQLTSHLCSGHRSCVFCALKLRFSDRPTLDAGVLRSALAAQFSDRFQLGEMDDSAECLEQILGRLHFHLVRQQQPQQQCTAGHCITHRRFGMDIQEERACPRCGFVQPGPRFTQLTHYAGALLSQLRHMGIGRANPSPDVFGLGLRKVAGAGDLRACPKCGGGGGGGCLLLRRKLLSRPDLLCLGLVWDSDRPSGADLGDLLANVGSTVTFG